MCSRPNGASKITLDPAREKISAGAMAGATASNARNYGELVRFLNGPYFDVRYTGTILSATAIEEACEALERNDTLLSLV